MSWGSWGIRRLSARSYKVGSATPALGPDACSPAPWARLSPDLLPAWPALAPPRRCSLVLTKCEH